MSDQHQIRSLEDIDGKHLTFRDKKTYDLLQRPLKLYEIWDPDLKAQAWRNVGNNLDPTIEPTNTILDSYGSFISNKLGTTSNVSLRFITDNTDRGILSKEGVWGLGKDIFTISSNYTLDVSGDTRLDKDLLFNGNLYASHTIKPEDVTGIVGSSLEIKGGQSDLVGGNLSLFAGNGSTLGDVSVGTNNTENIFVGNISQTQKLELKSSEIDLEAVSAINLDSPDIILGADNTQNIYVNGVIATSVVPNTHNTYSLGHTDYRWNDLYVGPGSIHIGNNGDDVTLSYTLVGDILDINKNVEIDQNLTVNGNASITGSLTTFGDVTLGNNSVDTIIFNGLIDSDIIPKDDDQKNLGDNTHRWKDLYLGPGSIHIGTNLNETIIHYDTDTVYFDKNLDINLALSVNTVSNFYGNLTAHTNTILGTSDSNDITLNGKITTNIVPKTSGLSLGTNTDRWNDLYLNGSSIYIGFGGISYDNTLQRFEFGGGDVYIQDNTILDLDVDINGILTCNDQVNINSSLQISSNTTTATLRMSGNSPTTGYIATSSDNNGNMIWTDPASIVSGGGGVTGSGTLNQIAFWNSSNTITGDVGLTYDSGTFSMQGVNLSVVGVATFGDLLGTDDVIFNSKIDSHFIPKTDDIYDLGDNTHRWRDLYLGPGSLHLGSSILSYASGILTLSGASLSVNTIFSDGGFIPETDFIPILGDSSHRLGNIYTGKITLGNTLGNNTSFIDLEDSNGAIHNESLINDLVIKNTLDSNILFSIGNLSTENNLLSLNKKSGSIPNDFIKINNSTDSISVGKAKTFGTDSPFLSPANTSIFVVNNFFFPTTGTARISGLTTDGIDPYESETFTYTGKSITNDEFTGCSSRLYTYLPGANIEIINSSMTITTGYISTGASTIPTISTANFNSSGFIKLIDPFDSNKYEYIKYTSKTATNFNGLTRGIFGTVAIETADNAVVHIADYGAVLKLAGGPTFSSSGIDNSANTVISRFVSNERGADIRMFIGEVGSITPPEEGVLDNKLSIGFGNFDSNSFNPRIHLYADDVNDSIQLVNSNFLNPYTFRSDYARSFGTFGKAHNTNFGLKVRSFSYNSQSSMQIFSVCGDTSGDSTTLSNSTAPIDIRCYAVDIGGTDDVIPLGASENLLVISNGDLSNHTLRDNKFIFKANGDLYTDTGTVGNPILDSYDDLKLLATYESLVDKENSDGLINTFKNYVDEYKEALIKERLISIDSDSGSVFVNLNRMTMLFAGAFRQINKKLELLETKLLNI